MSWNSQQIIQLLNLYKEQPCLYVPKHLYYHNKNVRRTALEEIALKLQPIRPGTTDKQVGIKFGSLRTSWVLHWKKLQLYKKCGQTHIPSLWYYNNMQFINDYIQVELNDDTILDAKLKKILKQNPPATKRKRTSENEDGDEKKEKEEDKGEKEEEEEEAIDVKLMNELENTGDKEPEPLVKTEGDDDKEAEQHHEVKTELTDEITIDYQMVEKEEQEEQDEDVLFGKFVAHQLKQIRSEETKQNVQLEIHRLLYEALLDNDK